MTEESPVAHLANMTVETNYQAPETKPAEAPAETPAIEPVVPEITPVEPIKVEDAQEPLRTESVKPEIQEAIISDEKENERAKLLIEARLRAERAENELKALKPAAKALGDRPKHPEIENFKTYEEFLTAITAHEKAVDEWNDRRIEAEVDKKANERIADTERARQADVERIAVETKDAASRAKHKDYDAVVAPIVPLIKAFPLLKDFIIKNPMGTEVAYELAKNQAVLEQLTRQNVWEAGETLINIANRLKKPIAMKPSNTPEPIKPVGTNEVAKVKRSTLSDGAYIAARRAEEMKARHLN